MLKEIIVKSTIVYGANVQYRTLDESITFQRIEMKAFLNADI
jgi:hypothetical protein